MEQLRLGTCKVVRRAFAAGAFALLAILLPACQSPIQKTQDERTFHALKAPTVLERWGEGPRRIGLVFKEPLTLEAFLAGSPHEVEGVFFVIGTLQGAFRSPKPVAPEKAVKRVRDFARFYLTRQKTLDRKQIERFLAEYQVHRYTEREARARFRGSPEAQALARTLVERSVNRRYAKRVLEGGEPVIYAVEAFASPLEILRIWGGRIEGVALYSPSCRFHPPKPKAVLEGIRVIRDQISQMDPDRLFDEAVRILREEYGMAPLFRDGCCPGGDAVN